LAEAEGISGLVSADLKVRKENTAERAASVLRNLIVRGDIEPGQPLREVELAPALGVSRNTIREALRILAREALVAPSHRNVYTVVQVSEADVPDIFRARGMIEFAAVKAIAEDDSALDLTEMRAAVDALRKLRPDVEWWEVVDADLAFHTAMVAQARSPRLSAIYKQLEGEIRLCLCVSSQFQVTLETLVDEHTEFLVLLEKGKYERFEKLLAASMDAAAARVIAMLGTAAAAEGNGAPDGNGSDPS
jgi:DNA-binding GntR family transcriptional regulator